MFCANFSFESFHCKTDLILANSLYGSYKVFYKSYILRCSSVVVILENPMFAKNDIENKKIQPVPISAITGCPVAGRAGIVFSLLF